MDWASHDAAKFACMHWHYSKSIPVPPLVKVGAWEDKKFIGVVLFSRGANNNLLRPYGLGQTEGCELTRIALTKHVAPVSKIISLSIKFLNKTCPNLRLIVSFADPTQGHIGGVYQASNWIYTGTTDKSTEYMHNGKRLHGRWVSEKGWKMDTAGKRISTPRPSECIAIDSGGKHRYLMALDESMKAKILPLSRPYPKRAKGQDAGYPPALGGSTPTCALQIA